MGEHPIETEILRRMGLSRTGGLRTHHLAESFGMHTPVMRRHLMRMEKRGVIHRDPRYTAVNDIYWGLSPSSAEQVAGDSSRDAPPKPRESNRDRKSPLRLPPRSRHHRPLDRSRPHQGDCLGGSDRWLRGHRVGPMTQLREDFWGRMVEPRDGKLGPWFDARRCQVCSRQSIQLICAECGEVIAEQEVYSDE